MKDQTKNKSIRFEVDLVHPLAEAPGPGVRDRGPVNDAQPWMRVRPVGPPNVSGRFTRVLPGRVLQELVAPGQGPDVIPDARLVIQRVLNELEAGDRDGLERYRKQVENVLNRLTLDPGIRFEAIRGSVLPSLRRFAPEILLVSAGFDAWRNDPLGGMRVTEEGFRRWGEWLRELAAEVCGGRVLAVLEGGYDLRNLPLLVEANLEGLAGGRP